MPLRRFLSVLAFLLFFPNPAIPIGNALGLQAGQCLSWLVLPIVVTIHRPRAQMLAVTLLAVPLMLSASVQMMWSRDSDLLLKSVALQLWVWPALIVAGALLERGFITELLVAAAAAVLVHALVSAYQLIAFSNGDFPFLILFQNPSFLQPTDGYALWVRRVTGLYPEPSAMAAACGPWVVLFAGLSMAPLSHLSFARKWFFMATAAGLAAILVSGTGYAFVLVACIGGVAIGRFVSSLKRRTRGSMFGALALVSVAIVVILIATDTLRDRVDNAAEQSWSARLASIRVGLMALTDGPAAALVGVGPGMSSGWVEKAGASELAFGNIPVLAVWSVSARYASETGLVGIVAMAMAAALIVSAIRQSSERLLGACCTVAWVMSITLTTSYVELEAMWLFMGVLLGWARLFPPRLAQSKFSRSGVAVPA